MQSIRVNTKSPYTVEIGSGLLEKAGGKIATVTKALMHRPAGEI